MCLLLDRILGMGILCVEKVDLPAPIFGLGLLVFGRSVGMNMGQPVLGCGQCIPQYHPPGQKLRNLMCQFGMWTGWGVRDVAVEVERESFFLGLVV